MEPRRKIKFLITDLCNEQCVYCPIHGDQRRKVERVLPDTAVIAIAKEAVKLGYSAVKLSGEYGEPLLRKDITAMIRGCAAAGATELGVATNGLGLAECFDDLVAAGLNKLCVSLDSLKATRYRKITGSDRLDTVRRGIERAAHALGRRVKVNMVVLKGVNADEIDNMRHWVNDLGATLQLIEMFPVPGRRTEYSRHYYSLSSLMGRLRKNAIYTAFYKPRKAELFVLGNGEHIQITSTRRAIAFRFGVDRLVVHPDGVLGNYDVRSSGVTLTGTERPAAIRKLLQQAAAVRIDQVGKHGVEAWTHPGVPVS